MKKDITLDMITSNANSLEMVGVIKDEESVSSPFLFQTLGDPIALVKNNEEYIGYIRREDLLKYAIINDITLTILGKQFQIDSLIVTTHAIYIIEVKNFEGPVTFDTILNQLTKGNGEKLQGYNYHPGGKYRLSS